MLQNKLISILFFTFGLFLVLYSSYYLGDFKEFGAGFMPTLAGIGILIFSLIDIISVKETIKGVYKSFKHVCIISVIILFYIFASSYLGFILTSLIITFPLIATYAECSIAKSFLISFLVILIIYYLFAEVLLVPLPQLFD